MFIYNMKINKNVNTPNKKFTEIPEILPKFNNKQIFTKLNRKMNTNNLNISVNKETEKEKEKLKNKFNSRKNYSFQVSRINKENSLKKRILMEGFNNSEINDSNNNFGDLSNFIPSVHYKSLLEDSNIRKSDSLNKFRSANQSAYLSYANSIDEDKSINLFLNQTNETVIENKPSPVKVKQNEWRKKLKEEKFLIIKSENTAENNLDNFLQFLFKNNEQEIESKFKNNIFLNNDFNERIEKCEENYFDENYYDDLVTEHLNNMREKNVKKRKENSFTFDNVGRIESSPLPKKKFDSSKNTTLSTTPGTKKIRPKSNKLILNKFKILQTEKKYNPPILNYLQSNQNSIRTNSRENFNEKKNSTAKLLPIVNNHSNSNFLNNSLSQHSQDSKNKNLEIDNRNNLSLSNKKSENDDKSFKSINSAQNSPKLEKSDKLQILNEFNEKAKLIQKYFRQSKMRRFQSDTSKGRKPKLQKILYTWNKTYDNLYFISTPETTQVISELHFDIYSLTYKKTFTKNIKIREIYQLREKIDRETINRNPNFFLDLVEIQNGEIKIKNILGSIDKKSTYVASAIFSSPKKTKKGSNKVFTENYSLELYNIEGDEVENMNLFDVNEAIGRNNENFEDITIASINTDSILAEEDEDNFEIN